jgi:hypothetical protein
MHDTLEMMVWLPSSRSLQTRLTSVMSSPAAGATTFFAPASRSLAALSRLVETPVDSPRTSTPRSVHGSSAGSRSASALIGLPAATISSLEMLTSYGSRTRIGST